MKGHKWVECGKQRNGSPDYRCTLCGVMGYYDAVFMCYFTWYKSDLTCDEELAASVLDE